MALRTHFNQPKIGCPGVAEFTVQRCETALYELRNRKIRSQFDRQTACGTPAYEAVNDLALHTA